MERIKPMEETKKLTTQELAMYIGCEVQCDESEIGKLTSININGWCSIEIEYDDVWIDCEYNEVKPILRPLNSMTEEEMIEIAKMLFVTDNYEVNIMGNYHFEVWGYDDVEKSALQEVMDELKEDAEDNECLITIFNGNKFAVYKGWEHDYWECYDALTMFSIFKYLLSKGFDIFNYIPQGLAIDATKL